MPALTRSGMAGRTWAVLAGLAVIAAAAATGYLWHEMQRRPRADPADSTLIALGRSVYEQHCASCHGAKLEGQPDWQRRLPDGRLPAPPHDPTGHTWHHRDQELFDMTKDGPSAVVPAYHSDMPAFRGVLSDREIWAVLAYIKSTWPPEIRARQPQTKEQ
jgi:mono/diheme cytochrome c family protein